MLLPRLLIAIQNVDYGVDDGDNVEAKRRGKGGRVDGEYNDDNEAESPDDEIISGEDTDVMERKRPRVTGIVAKSPGLAIKLTSGSTSV